MLSLLFNLVLANIAILFVVFNNFFTRNVDNENARLSLALAIPTGVPITVGNEAIEMLPLVADKKLKTYQKNQENNTLAKSLTY